jgi:hypothetical protein
VKERVYIAEVNGYDPVAEAEVVWKFATGLGYDAGGEDGWYAPRIEKPAALSRSMAGPEGGRITNSWGEISLVNIDGGIDQMANHYFDGREMTMKVGFETEPYDSFVTILNAQIEAVAVERERVSVRLRDRSVTLDKPFSSKKYLGDNVLPNGVQGTADDLIDQSVVHIYGRVALMAPVLVNTAKLIYQCNDGYCEFLNVFDAGAYLSRQEPDYTSLEEMQAYEPDSGCYIAWPEGGYFRLGATPFGDISASVAESLDYSEISAAGLLQRVFADSAQNRPDSTQPRTGADWHMFDLQKLDEQNAGSLGLIVEGEETTASLLDRICKTVGASWGFDALGALRVVRLDVPTDTPVVTLEENDILRGEREPDEQVPYWSATVKADKNYLVQDKSRLAGVVSEGRALWFKNETRDQKIANETVKATRLLSNEVVYDSLFNGIATARAEAKRRLDLYSARRDVLTLTLPNPLRYSQLVDVGVTIAITLPRLGHIVPKKFIVTSVRPDYERNTLDITCWG